MCCLYWNNKQINVFISHIWKKYDKNYDVVLIIDLSLLFLVHFFEEKKIRFDGGDLFVQKMVTSIGDVYCWTKQNALILPMLTMPIFLMFCYYLCFIVLLHENIWRQTRVLYVIFRAFVLTAGSTIIRLIFPRKLIHDWRWVIERILCNGILYFHFNGWFKTTVI